VNAPTAGDQLAAVYARIPGTNCRGLCQEGCGSIGLTTLEQARIEQRHGLRLPILAVFDDHCPALNEAGRCTIYDDRPTVCRLWGAVPSMPCPHGCEPTQMMTDAAGLLALADVEDLAGNPDRAGQLRRRAAR
jgi:hypothetical protein